MKWIDGTDLIHWADRRDSQSLFPEVLRRLVYATATNLRRVEFRSGEGVQLPGWDGYIEAPDGTVHVPQGVSGWELGTGSDVATKANGDYTNRSASPLGVNPVDAVFVFATPRRWVGKTAWAQAKQAEGIWREVRVYDADDLEAWLMLAPGVGAWLARQMGKFPPHVRSLDDLWTEFSSTTNPALSESLLVAGRTEQGESLTATLRGLPSVLHVRADTSDEAFAFMAACVNRLPEEDQIAFRSRMIATDDADTLRALTLSSSPLTILYDGTDTRPVAAAVQRSHHVVLPVITGGAVAGEIVLSRASRETFADALKEMGFAEREAFTLARETGRSISVFQRRYPVARLPLPTWAQPPHVHEVIGLLLAGSWDDQHQPDREIIAELTGKPYEEAAQRAAALCQVSDPPFRQAGTIFAAAAVRDAWRAVGHAVTRDELNRFATVAERILSLDDPRLTLPPNERWLAAVRGQVPRHSGALRQGIANTLALLNTLGTDNTIPHQAHDKATRVIARVLAPDTTWQRWYSVAGLLPLLAEAAPGAFLTAIGAQLAPAAPDLIRLFDEEGGGISPHSMHTHLLWALEVLAWDPSCLSRVTLMLARLAQLDPGGRLQNRPINTLRAIFLFWHPNTAATLAQREQAIDLLIARNTDVAWDLLTKMLPKSFDTGRVNAQPHWRTVAAPPMTYGDRDQGIIHILDRALTLAGMDAERLATLVHECGAWPPAMRERLITQLETFAACNPTPADSTTVWTALRQFVHTNRAHPDADWALPDAMLAPLAAVQDQLVPTDLITRYAWLFDDWWPNLGTARGDDHAATDAAIAAERQGAINGVLAERGHEGLVALGNAVKYPGFVGRDAAEVIPGRDEQRSLLMATLGSNDVAERILGQALVTRWHEREGEPWVDAMLAAPLSDEADRVVSFLLGLPFDRAVWTRVSTFGGDIEGRYWRAARAWLPQGVLLDDLTFAVECLIGNGRPFDALHLVGSHLDRLPIAFLVQALNPVRDALAAGADLPQGQMFVFDVERGLERLRAEEADQSAIARLEWFFLPLLGHGVTPTLTLHRQLANDPALFADIISAIYPPQEREGEEEVPPATEQEAVRARVAFRLLSSWHIVPGTTPDGNIDGAALDAWVDDARARCAANRREAVGDVCIGQVLAGAAPGPDGVLPPPAVRDLIERVASDNLDSGISSGVFNSRGTYTKALMEGGVQERAIAARYQRHADALAGTHPRASALVRAIAADYERFAIHEDAEAQQRDLD